MFKRMLMLACAFVLLAVVPVHAMAADGMQLALQTGVRGDFSMLENDRMRACFTVVNTSADQTVKSFEMRVYAVDAKGHRIWGDSTYYYWTTKKEIAPGETASSDDITLPDCSRVAQLYAVIRKVVFTDGTVVEAADGELNYDHWNIDWDE